MIKVEFDVTGLEEAQRQIEQLAEKTRGKVVAMALNKVAAKGRTEMSRRIREEFAIKASEVNAQVKVINASARKAGELVAYIEAFPRRRGHRSRNVMLFAAKQIKGRKTKLVRAMVAPGHFRMIRVSVGGGVSVKIRRNAPRKLIEHAFIGNKNRTVFIRSGKQRMPIQAVETIDVPSMFNTRRIHAAVVARIRAELPVELDRALRLELSRTQRAAATSTASRP